MTYLPLKERQKIAQQSSLQSRILSALRKSRGHEISLEKQAELCWELTELAKPCVDNQRILWETNEHKSTFYTITKKALKKYLKDYGMESYLRTLYNTLITKEF